MLAPRKPFGKRKKDALGFLFPNHAVHFPMTKLVSLPNLGRTVFNAFPSRCARWTDTVLFTLSAQLIRQIRIRQMQKHALGNIAV